MVPGDSSRSSGLISIGRSTDFTSLPYAEIVTRPGGRKNSSAPVVVLLSSRARRSVILAQQDVRCTPPAGADQLGVILCLQRGQALAVDPKRHAAGRVHDDGDRLVDFLARHLAQADQRTILVLPDRIDARTVEMAWDLEFEREQAGATFDVAASIGSGAVKAGSRSASRWK